MPIVQVVNQQGETVDRYHVPFVISTQEVSHDDLEIVREHRRMYARQVGDLSALQKQFGAQKDYESAKELKEFIKYFTSCEKCATLVINYWEKQTDLRTHDFPQELHTLLDYEFNSIEFYRDQRLAN